MKACIRNSGSSRSGSQTQLQKSWLVAIGLPSIVTKPMEAVRDTHIVPVGSKRAEELASPASLIVSVVSCASLPWSLRISGSASQGTGPPHHSGWRRLGVWPDSRRATSSNRVEGRPFVASTVAEIGERSPNAARSREARSIAASSLIARAFRAQRSAVERAALALTAIAS
jgi:hypothetical protein